MIHSIQQFCENGAKRLTDIFKTYTEDLTKTAEMVYGVTEEVIRLGCSIIAEEWESYDELLRTRKDLRQGWHIVRRDETSLLTSLGEVTYHKTLFKNTATGESCYLLDQLMGMEHHARITEDAETGILKEASESSYRKGGANASINGDAISKEAVSRLWTEVLDYLNEAYDMEAVDRIYINGDGAAWIRTGGKVIPKSRFALDKYHMHKYIIAATSHLEDTAEDARSEIYRAVHKKKKRLAEEVFDQILSITDKDTKRRAVENAKAYILGNWQGIMLSVKTKDANIRCSAEGHISHIYADRMSSRPMGWSRTGVDRMSRLRIYRQNQGDMLDLVRFQRKELKQAAGAEEVVYTAAEMIRMEKAHKRKLGTFADMPVYSIPYLKIKKMAAIKNHIWGL